MAPSEYWPAFDAHCVANGIARDPSEPNHEEALAAQREEFARIDAEQRARDEYRRKAESDGAA